ncbi:MAG: bi-domain-containing oxidoreductase [Alphaproteobacteria bacterium]|nr:bi-domain-containing oxidoreductase [Alphaproteobacteria bacterium]
MKQVIQSARSGKLCLKDVPAPRVRAGHLLVRVKASLISAGTERMVVDFAKKSLAGKAAERPDLVRKVLDKAKRDGVGATIKAVMARLDEPLPLGYSAAGTVEEVGAGLESRFHVGQKVAMCGAGIANHAEFDLVPGNLAAPVPETVPFEEACYGTVAAIALQGLRNLGPQLGEVVAVLGVGLIGQLAVQLLKLSGCRVLALDHNAARLDLAKKLGADAVWNLAEDGLDAAVAALSGTLGCDGILICAATDSSEPFQVAAGIARDRARVVLVGKTGTEFPFADFMKKELSVTVSRSYGPGRYDEAYEGRGLAYPEGFVRWTETANLAECVRLMAHGLKASPLTTHRFALERAEDAYTLVMGGAEPYLGVLLDYPIAALRETALPKSFPAPKAAKGACVLGVIGAGSFARTVLLPEFKKRSDVCLRTIATQRGMTADHAKGQFGFEVCTTDAGALLADPAINAVLIATRHASHADLVIQALRAGKHVLVEKPLAVSHEQLAAVALARQESQAFLMVGFNRRFAPLAVKMRGELAQHAGPKNLLIRVNAGALPKESWLNASDEGQGRILGEGCHFVDLARALVGAPISAVQAQGSSQGADELAATFSFADGSLAALSYTAQGDSAYSKERIEGFAGGAAVCLDNFLSLSVTRGGKTKTVKLLGQDKGHAAEIDLFVKAVALGGPAPVDEAETFETSLATLALVESLRTGLKIEIG